MSGSILLSATFTTVECLMEGDVSNNVTLKKPSPFPGVFARNIQTMWAVTYSHQPALPPRLYTISDISFPDT